MVARQRAAPVRGGVYFVNFDPAKGHEQRGFRPALVLSPDAYNARTSLALICPITSARKGYPYEVPVEMEKISGVVLSDQVRSLDWRTRAFRYVGMLPAAQFAEVQDKVATLIA